MPELLDLYRKANARQAARAIGQDPNQPRAMTIGVRAQGHESEIIGLPADPEICPALQVLDTGSADFGKFYFMPGYSVPGGPDVIR